MGECWKLIMNKENKTEGLEMTVKLLEKKDKMNNNGPYVCSQYSKLVGPKETVWQAWHFMGK